nr:nuclear transport factor 2 family protein [Nocardioides flavescens]
MPPFTEASATTKVRAAEDAWNTRDPERISLAYSEDSRWRNRSTFLQGRVAIVDFLVGKWDRELDYRLIKELWAFTGDVIAVRFAYEYRDVSGQWFRAYGNENWRFDEDGLMTHRHASINDVVIQESERLFTWDDSGARPADHPGLSELGL